MLAYTKTPFDDHKYAYGPAPDYDRSAWLKEKNTLGLDFPNVSVLSLHAIPSPPCLTGSLVAELY